MKKAKQLKEERASLLNEQSTLVRSAEGDNLTDEQNTKFDDLQDRIDALDKDIKRAEQFEANQARLATQKGEPVNATKNK